MSYQPGQLILNDKYRLEALVGQGAFAQLYRATHQALNAERAIKVLHRDTPGIGSTEYEDFHIELGLIRVFFANVRGEEFMLTGRFRPDPCRKEQPQAYG